MIVIILNTIGLALDTYPDPPEEETFIIHILNLIFTGIFTFECYVRMTGLGFKAFCAVGFNIFDFVTVTMSLLQIGMKLMGFKNNSTIFSILRTFRVFRVFKLFKKIDQDYKKFSKANIDKIKLYEDVVPVLKFLSKNCLIAVVTSKDKKSQRF